MERQRKISVPKSGMDGRGVSQGGLYGRGKATVEEEEEEEEEEETAFDDSNIRSLLQVRGLAFFLRYPHCSMRQMQHGLISFAFVRLWTKPCPFLSFGLRCLPCFWTPPLGVTRLLPTYLWMVVRTCAACCIALCWDAETRCCVDGFAGQEGKEEVKEGGEGREDGQDRDW